jgi:von Willebrand factor type A domain
MEHLTLAFQHMTKLIFGICLLGTALMSVPVQAQPETSAQGKILFILDGSGSMRAKMGNKDKMAIAKEVMTKLIKELPDNVRWAWRSMATAARTTATTSRSYPR